MKKKKNILLLITAILGLAYAIDSIVYLTGANNGGDDIEKISTGIATALVMPHLICTALAIIFNILSWFMNHRGFALTAGILHVVAVATMQLYAMFVIVQTILLFCSFCKIKKLKDKHSSEYSGINTNKKLPSLC